jgi:2-methylisocitrate lyase-like PEP mutase family enzyme
VRDIAELGVRRVSVGGALAKCAWAGFMPAATQLVQEGKFDGLGAGAAGTDLDQFFGAR